jgi:hypothetical protein
LTAVRRHRLPFQTHPRSRFAPVDTA